MLMRIAQNKKRYSYPLVAAALLGGLMAMSLTQVSHAATLTQVFVRFDSMQKSTGTTGTVCANPTTASTEAHVVVTFPTGYTLGANTDFTVSTTNLAWPTGGTAWLGIGTATNVSGQDVTFPSTDLVVGTLYCFNWTSTAAVTIKSSASNNNTGSVTTQDSGPSTIDTGSYATASVDNDTIVVTATIPPAFSFALSANTDALGNLSTGSVISSPTPRTATVNTNAKNGWLVWAKDTSTGLSSAEASYTINSRTPGTNSTITAGADGYNTGVTFTQAAGSATPAVDAAFVGGSTGKGGGLDTTLRKLATSSGTATNAVLTLTNNVTIAGATPAANDYTDTITVVGAGLF
ncbi:MAG TPA: hypothetical protein VLE99_05025 [Candidatus Saccharimonadales bacterium]|nr:hypothetical protein [Candidatus Saccharimonadales bacterium]